MAESAGIMTREQRARYMDLLYYYCEGMPYREIGRIAGCSERGVETRLYRVRQRLRAELGVFLPELTQS